MADDKKRWYSRVTGSYLTLAEFALYVFLVGYVGYYKGTKVLWDWSMEARGGHYLLSEDGLGLVDRTDFQWSLFVRHLFLYWVLGSAFLGLSYAVRSFAKGSPRARAIFYAASGIAYIGFASELQIIFPISIVLLNFGLSRLVGGKRFAPWIVWTFNLAVLYFTSVMDRFAKIHPSLAWMDDHRGLIAWNEVGYIIFLNCISFSMDYHWMLTNRQSTLSADKLEDEKKRMTWLWREEVSRPEKDYSLINLVAFTFYIPTWMGPIGGFNAFASQLAVPQRTFSRRDLVIYAARYLFALGLKELMDRVLFVNAINTDLFWTMYINQMNMLDYAVFPYYLLHGIWFKFLLMWRSWSLLALLDGIEYPENMNRCMSNNYTVEGFWRSWHRSFNQWLLRYVYVPLGGSRKSFVSRIFNIFAVFTLVIYFHAPLILKEPHYLFWGYAMALFIVPEILAQFIVHKIDKNMTERWYYRHLVSLGGAFNIFVLVLANLLGYGIRLNSESPLTRLDVIKLVLGRILYPLDWWFFLVVGSVLFSAVQFMLLYREYEKERDGKVKGY